MKMRGDFSRFSLGILVPPKIKIVGLGRKGLVQKYRDHRNEECEGPHISKSKSYRCELKQNKDTELLNILFPQIQYKKGPKIAKHVKRAGFSGFV